MNTKFPALLVALIMIAYWGRVVLMARSWQQRAGHSANFIPAEFIGKITRLLWVPIVGLWIALPLFMGLGMTHAYLLRPLFKIVPIAWAAVALASIAFIATLICWQKLGNSWRMGIDPNEKTQLVVTGPYSRIRHPIYSLSMLLMIASVLACPTIPMLIVAPIHLMLLYFEARREEMYLASIHGPLYLDYCRRVGRFIPRFAGEPHAVESRV